MLSSIGDYLQKNSKAKMWKEALIYGSVSHIVQKYLLENLKGTLTAEDLDVQIVVKEITQKEIIILLKHKNPTFLSWLKTETNNLVEYIQSELKQRINTQQKMSIVFK